MNYCDQCGLDDTECKCNIYYLVKRIEKLESDVEEIKEEIYRMAVNAEKYEK